MPLPYTPDRELEPPKGGIKFTLATGKYCKCGAEIPATQEVSNRVEKKTLIKGATTSHYLKTWIYWCNDCLTKNDIRNK